ncbi:hypothetical protein GGR50DRAFT_93665 [Xylaria sp. CBS 124048]|nr:hypothetical protein GGR50DRAFT_93665 [Xylaria sp. CBS 124048]
MGGNVWSEAEEQHFWRVAIANSTKRAGIDIAKEEKPWASLAAEMQDAMGEDARRHYTGPMLVEHYFQNIESQRRSPNATRFVMEYLARRDTTHGLRCIHHTQTHNWRVPGASSCCPRQNQNCRESTDRECEPHIARPSERLPSDTADVNSKGESEAAESDEIIESIEVDSQEGSTPVSSDEEPLFVHDSTENPESELEQKQEPEQEQEQETESYKTVKGKRCAR